MPLPHWRPPTPQPTTHDQLVSTARIPFFFSSTSSNVSHYKVFLLLLQHTSTRLFQHAEKHGRTSTHLGSTLLDGRSGLKSIPFAVRGAHHTLTGFFGWRAPTEIGRSSGSPVRTPSQMRVRMSSTPIGAGVAIVFHAAAGSSRRTKLFRVRIPYF